MALSRQDYERWVREQQKLQQKKLKDWIEAKKRADEERKRIMRAMLEFQEQFKRKYGRYPRPDEFPGWGRR